MNRSFIATLFPAVLMFALAGSSLASAGASGLSPSAVVVTPIAPPTWSFGIQFMPGVPVSKVDWELEMTYGVNDARSIYDHYDRALRRMGFSRTDHEADDDEIEAEYSGGGLKATLEVASSNGRTKVQVELEGIASATRAGSFGFERFGGIDLPFHEAEITKLEWEVEFLHATTDHARAFRYYDEGLIQQGWRRTGIDHDDDEMEANYVNGELKLELEVERKNGQVEVEFELKN